MSKADKAKFPITVMANGVTAKIRRIVSVKRGTEYVSFLVDYTINGKRRQISRSDLADAKAAAQKACNEIANVEEPTSTVLVNGEQFAYLRAKETSDALGLSLDHICRDHAEALDVLGGRVSILTACRDWVRQNADTLPTISVAEAVEKVQAQSRLDNRSKARQHELQVLLDMFAKAFQCDAHAVQPGLVSSYLSNLKRADGSGEPLSERSKRNHKDVIKHLNTWLCLHGFLAKGTNWMEGVQRYSKRKPGDVGIYTAAELKLIMAAAEATPTRAKWMPVFCALSAFCTIRHSEVKRLDWRQVDLSDKAGESFIEILPVAGTKSSGRRRLIPVNDTLKAWLVKYRKAEGKIVPVDDSSTLLSRLIRSAGVTFIHNGLRHSSISYSVAKTGDVPRIADESGNSAAMIHTHYLRRVKPSQASDWFSVMPVNNTKASPRNVLARAKP